MFKKIALAAVAATLIASPAFAAGQMVVPTSSTSGTSGVNASDTATAPIAQQNKKHKKNFHKKALHNKNLKKAGTSTTAP